MFCFHACSHLLSEASLSNITSAGFFFGRLDRVVHSFLFLSLFIYFHFSFVLTMSTAVAHRGAFPRRILGELDPKRDLNTPRGLYKRDPIVLEQENEAAVLEGLELGVYDFDEVMALTNFRLPFPAATTRIYDDSDDEGLRFEGDAFERREMSDEELMEGLEEDEDELLGDAMAQDLGEEMGDHDDEPSESEDELDQAFNPAALGLKDINNLAHFGVSSHRPGNGVAELLSDDLDKYWQ